MDECNVMLSVSIFLFLLLRHDLSDFFGEKVKFPYLNRDYSVKLLIHKQNMIDTRPVSKKPAGVVHEDFLGVRIKCTDLNRSDHYR